VDSNDDERTEQLKRLRRGIAEQWPESRAKERVLDVLDEMILEADEVTGA
jgi:hypothetical protein